MKVTITTPPVEKIVTVEMSEAEAQTLRIICGHIGGDPNNSRRKHIDALYRALSHAGILCDYDSYPTGSIYFKDEEEICR